MSNPITVGVLSPSNHIMKTIATEYIETTSVLTIPEPCCRKPLPSPERGHQQDVKAIYDRSNGANGHSTPSPGINGNHDIDAGGSEVGGFITTSSGR